MPIRGFKNEGIVACFDRRAGIAEPSFENTFNIDHPQNAPAKTPADYLDLLTFHSSCFQYEVAFGPTDVTVSHAALAVVAKFYGVSWESGPITGGSPAGVGWTVYGNTRETDILLVSHNLGYVPKFMVALDGRRLPDGHELQYDGVGGNRQVSAYATTTGIYLREIALSGSATLPAISQTYKVYVFRTRSSDPAQPLFGLFGGALVLARGIINSARKYLRRGSSDSAFAMNMGPTLDVHNGAVRSASGGVVVTETGYGGSMSAPPFRSVGL